MSGPGPKLECAPSCEHELKIVQMARAILNALALTKTGAGTLTLTGTDSYSGGTTINAGMLAISVDSKLGAAGTSLSFGGGTLENTASFTLGAARPRIRAAIGPCIARHSYEVGPEFPQPFVAEDPGNIRFFAPAPGLGRFLFDLPGYISRRLMRTGIATVEVAPHDTVADEERFFSYRRARLRGERSYGRGLSAIVLEQ